MELFSKRKKKPSKFDLLLQEQLAIFDNSPVEPIFSNAESNIYCQPTILNGYKSLSLIITGCLKINTIEGCTVTFHTEKDTYVANSDSEIVKGDYSDVLNIGLTNFDIDLEDDLIVFSENKTILSVTIETRNGQISKKKVVFEYPTVNVELFNKILNAEEEEEEE